ncbi:MAG TPA: hypothetical protein VFQ47_10070 [Nitrososphaera sp.]|nr:hypothetical protein [Nitrososphaera sp.]
MSTKIEVFEKNDPLLTLWVLYVKPDKSMAPYDLTGATLEFYQKADPTDADSAPLYTSTGGGTPAIVLLEAPPLNNSGVPITGATERNAFTVQMSSTNLANAGTQFYRVDAIKSAKRQTIMEGPLVIKNV